MVGSQLTRAAALDQAAADVGRKIQEELASKTLGVKNIAVFPFVGDRSDLSSVIRSAMSRQTGPYTFVLYTKAPEWDALYQEIERGVREGDTMNPETVQKFGRMVGADALLGGEIRTADADTGKLSVNMILIEVATGKHLWGGLVNGSEEATSQEIVKLIDLASERVGFAVAEAIQRSPRVTVSRIGVLPLRNDRRDVSETFEAALSRIESSTDYYTRSSPNWADIYREQGGQTDLAAIRKQDPRGSIQAVLTGEVRLAKVEETPEGPSGIVRVNMQLLDLSPERQGRSIWGGSFEGVEAPAKTPIPFLNKLAEKLGPRFADSLRADAAVRGMDIFIAGIAGDGRVAAGAKIVPQITRLKSERDLKFFDGSNDRQVRLTIERFASTQVGDAEVQSMVKSLARLQQAMGGDGVDSTSAPAAENQRRQAVLFGRVLHQTHETNKQGTEYGSLEVEVKLYGIDGGGTASPRVEILWQDSLREGDDAAPAPAPTKALSGWLRKLLVDNPRNMAIAIAVAVVGLVVIVLFFMLLRRMTTPR